MGDILQSCVQKIKELPTLPSTAQEILSLTSDPMLAIDRLLNIVESDPAISGKILSVANSAFFGYPVRTTKLNDAIMRIGMNNVKSIAIGISIFSFLDDGKKTSGYMMIFNHSVAVALTAQYIAKNLNMALAEDILIDGLLHDLGFMVLHSYFPDIFREIVTSFEQGGDLLRAEKNTLSYTHGDIGFWLANKWKLPASITDTNLYHHTPSLIRRDEQRVAIVHIADYIAAKNMYSPVKKDPGFPLDHACFDILAISDNDLMEMEESICNIPLSDEIFTLPRC